MKVESKGLQKAFKNLPRKQRKYIGEAIRKSVNEGVIFARTLAPSGSGEPDPELGRLKQGIHAKFQIKKHAFVGAIEAAAPTRDAQVKAMSIEFGRTNSGGNRQPKGSTFRDTGTTMANPFMRRTQSIIGPKHVGRMKRAMNKAAKELGLK